MHFGLVFGEIFNADPATVVSTPTSVATCDDADDVASLHAASDAAGARQKISYLRLSLIFQPSLYHPLSLIHI